jgi:spore coat polysaccharide biosynthesis predicted glycosyltransferase SpsG
MLRGDNVVLFVVGGCKEKGYEHVIRASILAHTCMGRGLEVSFICAHGDVSAYLKRRGFPHVHVTDETHLLKDSAAQKPSLLVWDAGTPLALEGVEYLHHNDVLVLEFDASDGTSYADEVVNGFEPTLHSATGRQFQLVGPKYFVIDNNFCNAREWRRAASVQQNGLGLFICFGGSDPGQLLESTLEVLTDIPACRSIQIRAVAGFDRRKERDIRRRFSAFKNLQVHAEANAAVVAQLMRFSFLGIVSFGKILVEAMAAELPVLMVNPTEAHEEYAARVLKGIFTGTGKSLGYSPRIDWNVLHRELAYLLDRPREVERMQAATHRLVDGQGAQRIARHICNYLENRGKGPGSRVRLKEHQETIPLSL